MSSENLSSDTEMNRRKFVILATVTAASTACAACFASAAEAPAASAEAKKQEGKPPPPNKGTVNVGKKDKYAKDGVYDEFAKSNRVLVVRHDGKIYAPTATCTHKNAALRVKDGVITCPNHGSKFSVQGTSTKGPAKGSLYRYALSVDADGNIIVNKEKQFAEKEWEQEGAFLKV
jgi:nitrite reductase/ring-hydroxylating ferredoxin subunit